MKSFLAIVLALGLFSSSVSCGVVLLLAEQFEDCGEDKMKTFDFSELIYEYVNDTMIFLTGNLKLRENISPPWKSHIYIEKFDRGRWNIAIFDRKVDDFCKSIQRPTEVWYRFTSRLKHKNCPFKVGDIEYFENMKVGKLPEYVSYAFVGKYRISFESFLPGKDKEIKKECFRMGFEIMEEP